MVAEADDDLALIRARQHRISIVPEWHTRPSCRCLVPSRLAIYSTTTVSRMDGWMAQKAANVPGPGKRILTVSRGSWAPEL